MLGIVTWPRNPWSIFDEIESLQEDLNQAFGDWQGRRGYGRPFGRRGRTAYPAMNVWSSKDGVVIDAELPGANPKDVDISVVGDELTVRGKVNDTQPEKDEAVWRRERPSGEFARSLQLPFRANAEGVKATYKNGILRIHVPRSEEEKPKKIAIEA